MHFPVSCLLNFIFIVFQIIFFIVHLFPFLFIPPIYNISGLHVPLCSLVLIPPTCLLSPVSTAPPFPVRKKEASQVYQLNTAYQDTAYCVNKKNQ